MIEGITLVVTVNDEDIFQDNFLSSPCWSSISGHEILAQRDFASATVAYNDAIRRASHDLLVFAHQDVVFPACWLSDLDAALAYLEKVDPGWGVLGCAGVNSAGQFRGHCYSSGQGILKGTSALPARVETLDEMVLILRRSSGLTFDEKLPHFHMYGADICLRAADRGKQNYAIAAYCVHNTEQKLVLPREFYECCDYVRRTWAARLPVHTTCIRLTRLNIPAYLRRLQECNLRYIRRKSVGEPRTRSREQLLWLAESK